METIRQILNKKGSQVYSVTPETTVYDTLKLMADKNIGAVVVLNDGKLSKEIPVNEIMSSNVICIDPNQTINNTQAVMIQKRIRHLPVMENDTLIGIVSIGDVVDAVLEEKTFIIDQLATYIKGVPETGD